MKLHKDGSIEGTPTEIAEYTKLQSKREQFKVMLPIRVTPAIEMTDHVSPAAYVCGLLSAIGRGYYH